MMPGMIMLWYGSVATIPSGWALCDGTNNTPDLRGKFVKGVSPPLLNPGATGGSTNHLHSFTGDGHAHDLVSGDYIHENYPAGAYGHTVGSSPATGDTDLEDNQPPYMALCYIMKLPIP